jgi:hypothetical protein
MPFEAVTVNVFLPDVVGVPEITPVALFNVRPAGSVPEVSDHVIGVSPVAASVWLYAVLTEPSERLVVVIVGAAVAVIVILKACVASETLLLAVTVKLNVPAAVGVPDISPVSSFKLRPGVKSAGVTVHSIGAVPVADSALLYAVPTEPSGRLVVVIAGATGPAVISMLNAFEASGLTPFVAAIVKLNVPAVVGVPAIWPVVVFKSRPAGRFPEDNDHVIVASPVAAKVWLYASLTIPPGRLDVVIDGGMGAITVAIVILNPFWCDDTLFAAVTVNVIVPSVVGEPDISPVETFRLRPAGSEPPDIDQLIGPVPLAVSVWLYAAPTEPPESVVVVISGATGAAVIAMLKSFVASGETPLAAVTVNAAVSTVVGVPAISPVAAFNVRPAGSVPVVTDQVMGLLPVAVNVWLYAVPMTPPLRFAVVIAGGPDDAVAVTVILSPFWCDDALFVAVTVNVAVPAAVGVPEISPVVAFRLRPAGNEPPDTDQLIGPLPVAARISLYSSPIEPSRRLVVVIAGATGVAVTVMLSSLVASGKTPLAAVTVNVDIPSAVGVPDISPVAAFSTRPAGSEPVIDQFIEPVPAAKSV